jgi:hypothetical protein
VQVHANPSNVAWYADGRLHLEHVILDLPGVRQFEPVWTGAAYGDEQGRVVFVTNAGVRTLLGHKDPGTPLVVSDSHGWVVWAEADRPRLVVKELSSFGTVATRELAPAQDEDRARPVALVADTVYYEDGAGAHGWTVTSGHNLDMEADGLLDVSLRLGVFQAGHNELRASSPYSLESALSLPGTGAALSKDGRLLLTRDASEQTSFGPVVIYDTYKGKDLSVGLGPGDVALAAELGPDRTVTYVVARSEDRPENADFLRSSFSGQLELRTCEVDTGRCESLERFPSTGSRPLLAYSLDASVPAG